MVFGKNINACAKIMGITPAVKILSGNGFKNKIRMLKIFLKNDDILLCDFNNHKFFHNNKLIYKSKKTPVSLLLDKFYKNIKYGLKDNDKNNIIISIKAIKQSIIYL